MNNKVDVYIVKEERWKKETVLLRRIVLDCLLTEELKWGVPCYTFQKSNIVLIHGFKEYCALLFMKGALLQDTHNLLIQQTENVQSGRQIRFTNAKEIAALEPVLKAYLFEALQIEKAGLKVEYKKTTDFPVPEKLERKMAEMPALKAAFEALSAGRKKGYCLYFSEPKQSATRVSRIEKYIPLILIGKGIRDCTCGLSKRMPNCDGSHKYK